MRLLFLLLRAGYAPLVVLTGSKKCTPAFKALLSVMACMFPGRLDGQADKQGHSLQFSFPPLGFNGVVESLLMSLAQYLALWSELQELLAKDIISVVPS